MSRSRLAPTLFALLLLVSAGLRAAPGVEAAPRRGYRRARLSRTTLYAARRFERALRQHALDAHKPDSPLPGPNVRSHGDLRYIAERGVKALDALIAGKPLDPYLHRAASLLGLASTDLEALLAREYNKNRQKRAEHVLSEALAARGVVDDKSAAAIDAAYAVKLWRHFGDKQKATRAERSLRHLARAAGLDAGKLLAIDVKVNQSYGKSLWQFSNTAREVQPARDRKALGNPQWWTGAQPTYLDLMHRRLPELLRARFAAHRGKQPATFRVLNVGFEDGSQTMLLGALVDATIARMAKREPKMRDFLAQLKVEIVATDAMQKLDRKGRTLRFGNTNVEQQDKSGVLVQERGRAEAIAADRQIAAIERENPTPKADIKAHRELMKKLADAGQLGRVLASMLTLSPRVDVVANGSNAGVQMRYRIKSKRWRIEDRIAGETINKRAGDARVMRFEHADLTKPLPKTHQQMDLVVCTNVVPYIALYKHGKGARDDAGTNAAANNLRGALRKGGALIVDGWSTGYIIGEVQPTFLSDMWKSGRSVWVSDHTGTMDPLTNKQR